MPIRRHNIANILLYLIAAICLYLIQRISVFDIPTAAEPFNFSRELYYFEYIIAFAGIILLSLWFFLIEHKRGAAKFHVPLIILLSILFIISVVNIFIFPTRYEAIVPVHRNIDENGFVTSYWEYDKPAIIEVTMEQRFLYVISSFSVLFLAYLLLYVFPRKIRFTRQLNWLMYIFIIFGIITMVYSYINEALLYKNFFTTLMDETKLLPQGMKSFYGNKNVFGFTMTFSLMGCLYLHHSTKRWWWLPLGAIFYLQNILLTSKTTVIMASIVLALYLLMALIFRFKKHLVSSLIIAGVVVLIGAAIGAIIIVHHYNNEFLHKMFFVFDKYIRTYSFDNMINYYDVSGRVREYDRFFKMTKGAYWGIGFGFGNFNNVFRAISLMDTFREMHYWNADSIVNLPFEPISFTDSPHNSYFQLIGTGGILLLVIYVIFVLYAVYSAIRIMKKHPLLSVFSLSVILATLIGGISESITLFFMGPLYINSFFLTLLATVPAQSAYYHDKHPSDNAKYLADYEVKDTRLKNFDKTSLVSKSIYFFLTLAAIICCALLPQWQVVSNAAWLPTLVMSLRIALLVLPLLAQLIFDRKTRFEIFIIDTILPYLLIYAVLGGFIHIYCYAIGNVTTTLMVLLLGLVLILYFMAFSRIKYFNSQAGIITLLLDKVCNQTHKYQSKHIEVNNEKDSFTLQEKLFYVLTPKRLRK